MSDLLIPAVILGAFALGLAQLVASLILIAKLNRVSTSLSGKSLTVRRPRPASLPSSLPTESTATESTADLESADSGTLTPAEAWLDAVAQGEASTLPDPAESPSSVKGPGTLARTLIEGREGAAGSSSAQFAERAVPPPVPPPEPSLLSAPVSTAAEGEKTLDDSELAANGAPRTARAWGLSEEPPSPGLDAELSSDDDLDLAKLRPMGGAEEETERVRLELRLGRQIPVILGSIALVFAGVWLVKLFADRGFLPPERRILLAGFFSLGLVGCGEWFRARVARISRALVVSGVLVGYATIWAAERLYGFLGAEGALVTFGAWTAAALILGRRFGVWVTAAGMLGGFLIPALVGPESYEPRVLFGCLALLQLGLATDQRVQQHRLLSILAIFGSFAWFGFWLFESSGAALRSPIAALYLFLTTFVSVPAFASRKSDVRLVAATGLVPGWLFAMLFFFLLGAEGKALIGIGCFASATLLLTAFRTGTWAAAPVAAGLSWIALLSTNEVLNDRGWFVGGLAAIALLFIGAPFLLALERARLRNAWAVLSAVTLVASAFISYVAFPGGAPWGGWGVALFLTALVAAAGAVALAGGRREAGDELPVVAFTWAATWIAAGAALLTLAPVEIGVAWSLLALLLIAIDRRASLATSIEWLATPLFIASGVRLLLSPATFELPIASHPLFNWLPWGYGVPALAAGFAGTMVARGRRAEWAPFFHGLSVVLVLTMVHLLVRHAFHPEAATLLGGGRPTEGEGLAYSVTWIVTSLALIGLSLRKRSRAFRYTGLVFMVAAVGKVFLWDARILDDFYRVASYFGLGVSLILLSWAYHKLIPAWEERLDAAAAGESSEV